MNTIFECITDALEQGEGIEIRGFGSFTVRQYRAYEGRNPRTGEEVRVAPKRLPYFKVGKELRERLNEPGAAREEWARGAAEPPTAASPERGGKRKRGAGGGSEAEDVI